MMANMIKILCYDGKWAYGVSCVEYTNFNKFGITVDPLSPNSLQAEFPANTNILPSAELIGSSKDESSLSGMVLNVKKHWYMHGQFWNKALVGELFYKYFFRVRGADTTIMTSIKAVLCGLGDIVAPSSS